MATLNVDVTKSVPHRSFAFFSQPDAAIADAVVAHALNATFSDTEVEAALNALGVKINAVLTVLRNGGVVTP